MAIYYRTIPEYITVSPKARELIKRANDLYDKWDDEDANLELARAEVDNAGLKDAAALREAVINGTEYAGDVHETKAKNAAKVAEQRAQIAEQEMTRTQAAVTRALKGEIQTIIPQATKAARDALDKHVAMIKTMQRDYEQSVQNVRDAYEGLALIQPYVTSTHSFAAPQFSPTNPLAMATTDLISHSQRMGGLLGDLEGMATHPSEVEQKKLGFKPTATDARTLAAS